MQAASVLRTAHRTELYAVLALTMLDVSSLVYNYGRGCCHIASAVLTVDVCDCDYKH
jgi:hypothetical protein